MISSILATDMGLHFDYMKRLGFLQEKLHENGGTDGWNGRLIEEQRTLACSLLIKCADISNVVSPLLLLGKIPLTRERLGVIKPPRSGH